MSAHRVNIRNKIITLWAQNTPISSVSLGEKGSAVVEAVLTLPVFLAAICTVLAIGQMLFAQVQVWHCLSQTADQIVQKEEVKTEESLLDLAYTYAIFHSLMSDQSVCNMCIKGGSRGILLTQNTGEDQLDLTASYYLQVPVPYFNHLGLLTKKTIHRRLFTGYIAHEGNQDASDPTVYIAKYGQVYHMTMNCSKICVKIADPTLMQSLLASRQYDRCEKCMKQGQSYPQIYITVQGEACHSSLACGGLKRSIRAKKLSEVEGMRKCKNCGGD